MTRQRIPEFGIQVVDFDLGFELSALRFRNQGLGYTAGLTTISAGLVFRSRTISILPQVRPHAATRPLAGKSGYIYVVLRVSSV